MGSIESYDGAMKATNRHFIKRLEAIKVALKTLNLIDINRNKYEREY